MSTNANKKKTEQLGMSIGTASGRLRKQILFDLVQKINQDICHHCKEKIESERELSIEHKIPWLDSENPKKRFFDLDNIAFSHLSCNSSASRNGNPKTAECGDDGATKYRDGCRCQDCKDAQARRKRDYMKRKNYSGIE